MNRNSPTVELRHPDITMHHDDIGGIDIKIDDFVFVHVNYDHRYTNNAHRLWVAKQIVNILTSTSHE